MLGALLLVGGGLGDRVGRRRVFLGGIVIFTLASIVCAVAPTTAILIAARVVQGIGAAALVPQSLAIISATFPKDVRSGAIAAWAAASAVTTALGPPLGGFLIDTLSWRAAFWINVPLAAAALWLTLERMPETRNAEASGPIDWLGAALAVAAFGALTLGLTLLSESENSRLVAGALLAAGAALLAPFLLVEARTRNPVMPLALFRSRVFTATNVVTLFLYGAMAGALFLLPFELIGRRGMSAASVGLAMLPIGLIIGAFSRRAGKAADRHGVRPFLTAGSVLVGAACAALALQLEDFWLGVLAPIMLLSAGMAAVVSPLTTAVMNSVPDAQAGAASGVNNAASRLAGLFAVAILATVAALVFASGASGARFEALPPAGDPARAAMEAAFINAYAAAMALAAAFAFAAAVCSFLLLREPQPRT
jgi:EmrB/QacA subfamily drug resistance transporter